MEDIRNHRHRNTALLLICSGLFILLYHLMGSIVVISLAFIVAGLYRIRFLSDKKGYVFTVIGVIILVSSHFYVVLAAILISLGFFYYKSKQLHRDDSYFQKHSIIESLKRDKEPWVLRNMSMWNMVGEMNLDLSMAMPEQEETTIILQGILGDIDIMVPADCGIEVSAAVTFGKINLIHQQETGVLNKAEWRTPGYDQCEMKVKIIVYYAVGDVDIKLI